MANKPTKQSNKGIILAILGALILALIMAAINLLSANEQTNSDNFALALTIVFGVIAIGTIIYFIIASKRNFNRCPKCKMKDDFIIVREKEISHDAKTVTKKIQKKIRDTNGQVLKTTEEIGQVTIVTSVSHQQRKCKNCYNMWDVTIKKRIEY